MDGLDERKAVDLVTELIAVDGVSGEEEEIADLVVEKARRAGVPAAWIARDGAHRRSPAGGKCGNVIITLPGTRRAPRLMFSAHLDTVEIARGSVPVREGDRIRPRGDTALGGVHLGSIWSTRHQRPRQRKLPAGSQSEQIPEPKQVPVHRRDPLILRTGWTV